ncbi:MAG: choice-of-anchor D domain-containing protein [Lutibacter sp.]|uniref:LamG-like jellyroll fold domain-containing protein n=1 Tax=Lutibacter sp. TaxID=1925666 RepID=UPI00179A6030|nr:LamG-like jellyroll fold domain-containing protein [Lutibacter sp.]MBT8316641.1 choice-of-anchor D domain-containing protein [Lutibacter sp.]NNJ57501.1 choice-of-anchor D domain-containing protein [Lutibacter sp.]
MKKIVTFLILAVFIPLLTFSQTTIWEEDFTYSDGTTVGTSNRWTATGTANGYFEVRSNEFRGNNLDAEQILETESINISGYSNVSLSVDIIAVAAALDATDYVEVYYILDSAPEVLFTTNGSVTGNFTGVASETGLSGSSIKIRIKVLNTHTNETWGIDDILVTGILSSPEINILGNGVTITDGDSSPSFTDETDFGSTNIGSNSDHTFTIQNTGTAILNLTGSPIVGISGDVAFTILTQPSAASIASGGSDLTFTVRFTPTLTSNVTATISIASNDPDEDPYSFTIQGIGVAALTKGPGGITTDLQLWLKANDGLGYSDGQSVSLWSDQGRGSDATVNLAGQEPTYRDHKDYNINFNPVVDFDSSILLAPKDTDFSFDDLRGDFLVGSSGMYTQDLFVVVLPDTPISNAGLNMDLFCGDEDILADEEDVTGVGFGEYSARFTNESLSYCIGTSGEYGVAENVIGTNNYDNVGIINARNNVGNTQQELYYNSNDVETIQANLSYFTNVSNSRYWIGRSEGYEAATNARIVEIITFSSRQDDTTERNRIESYLAIKYGITLGVNGTSQDYVDSSGNVIWDQSANAGYNFDIAGIGRDDNSQLNQKQSSSVNNATDVTGPIEGILTIGLTDIYTTNNENIATNATNTFVDKEFLVWGNNGANLDLAATTINVDMSDGISGLSTPVSFTGMQRIWKVVETGGDVSKVEISIPKNAIRNISPPGSYLMFISDTDIFDPTADYRVLTEISGNLYTDYDFDGTKYITFGYSPEVVVERSIYFDGVVDYVDMDDVLDLNPSEFTVSSWIKRGVGSTNTSILSKRDAAYTEGYDFKISPANKVEMSWGNLGAQKITSNTTIPQDEWHHVAVIYSGGTASLFIDGVLDTAASLSNPVSTTQNFHIAAAGKNTPTAFFEGNIDEVRIWDIALTVDQLHYVMNQEIEDNGTFVNGKVIPKTITKNEVSTIPWTDLAGYYPMSVYTYTNTNDASGNNNQGALRNLDTVDWQTAPLPYVSDADGAWDTPATWLNNLVQDLPNSTSIIDGVTPIDWNIVQTAHNISSGDKDITILGFISTAGKLSMAEPLEALDENNSGQSLTVTHYFELDGALDLIGESQLIQTEGSILDIDSGGYIEKDQQGTANSFNYNYWSSSVGPISGNTSTRGIGTPSINSNNSVSGILEDGTNTSTPVAINFQPSYAAADTGVTSPIIISSYWLFTYNGTNDDYDSWISIDQNTSLLAGEGYTMKGSSGACLLATNQNYVFKGKPNNGDITLPIALGNNRLIGNPYPSAIDADEFIKDNIKETINSKVGRNTANIFNGALYFWHHFGQENSHNLAEYVGGYATYTLMGGTQAISNDSRINHNMSTGGKTPERYIPVSQGFFVNAYLPSTISGTTTTVDGGSIVFKNSQRIFQIEVPNAGNGSVFFKSAAAKSKDLAESTIDTREKIRLMFDSPNGYHRQLLIGVDENTTNDFNIGYDAPIADLGTEDMFWIIDESKFVIQGVPNFNKKQEFPIGLKTEQEGKITISIDSLENIDETDTGIYIKDYLTGETYNIQNQIFEIYLPAGEYLERFALTFQPRIKTLEEATLKDGILVYMNNKSSELCVKRIVDTEIIEITLYNYLGQMVENWNKHFTNREFSIPIQKSSGVYIVKFKTINGIISKKIVLN